MIKHNLGYQAVWAILLGIAVGLFFGPLCSVLKPIGDAFIFVLQIIVIPYIPSLLMHGLGSLSPDLAKKLFKRGWFILVILWFIVLGACYTVQTIIPAPLPNPATDFTLEDTIKSITPSPIIPGTKFYDIFNNVVPIITFFSLIFGMAVMHLSDKEPLLALLDRVNNTLDRMIKWITIVSPIGIFCHISYVMGTVNFADLAKLQLFLGLVIFTTLYLSIWVLPMLTSCLTSIPYKELMREYRIVAFLPFATAIPTIALPYINNSMRRLAERKNLELGTFKNTSQTMVPIGFGFAQIGNFLPLLFILFLSFFYRHPLVGIDQFLLPVFITLFSIGIPQFTFVALPFLIKTLDLPPEGFSLYAEISAITLNFQVLLSTISMLTFIYLVVLRYYGLLQVNWKRLFTQGSTIAAVLFGVVIIGKSFIHTTDNYHELYYSLNMKEIFPSPPKVTVFRDRTPLPPDTAEPTLARILHRGIIRVGYDVRNIPFCYMNKEGEIVGYDIAYAYQLALDLDVKLELVPICPETMNEDINNGYYDVIMSALIIDEQRILNMEFSNSYIEQANALVVPVKTAHTFQTIEQIGTNPNIKIGASSAYYWVGVHHFPTANIINNPGIDDLTDHKVEAQLWSELPAYIWCLANPAYTTTTLQNTLGKKYFAYAVRLDSEQFVHFINEWIDLKREQGFELMQREYWFLGKSPSMEKKRWSILTDVLHWK